MVVNVAASITAWNLGSEWAERWILTYGAGLHPLQWVTSNFLHDGILHLLGNMLFLWVFGLVVEGKVGLGPFLGIYFGIGITQCAVEQVLFLGAAGGGSLGASAIIFGLMGISMIWAPENKVDVLYFFWIVFLVRGGSIALRMRTVCAIFLAFQIVPFVWYGMLGQWASSELLHLMGLFVGVPLGIVLLRSGLVDCEGWDWFSVRRGDPARRAAQAFKDARLGSHPTRPTAAAPDTDGTEGEFERDLLRGHLQSSDAVAALETYRGFHDQPGAPVLGERDLRLLILLFDAKEVTDFLPRLLAEYHQRFPTGKRSLHLMYAGHLIVERRQPSKGLKVLEGLDPGLLVPSEAVKRDGLADQARRMIDDGVLELADD